MTEGKAETSADRPGNLEQFEVTFRVGQKDVKFHFDVDTPSNAILAATVIATANIPLVAGYRVVRMATGEEVANVPVLQYLVAASPEIQKVAGMPGVGAVQIADAKYLDKLKADARRKGEAGGEGRGRAIQ